MPRQTTLEPALSPERTRLADCHLALADAEARLAAAIEEESEAGRDYWSASAQVQSAANAAADVRATRIYVPEQVAEINERILAANAAVQEAERPLPVARQAFDAAQSRRAEAEWQQKLALRDVDKAATAAVRAAALPVAAALTAEIDAAIQVILKCGPDLQWLLHHEMVGADVSHVANHIMELFYKNPGSWLDFERRYRASPWRNALESAKMNAEAPFPVS